jgi:hypothetical protein
VINDTYSSIKINFYRIPPSSMKTITNFSNINHHQKVTVTGVLIVVEFLWHNYVKALEGSHVGGTVLGLTTLKSVGLNKVWEHYLMQHFSEHSRF